MKSPQGKICGKKHTFIDHDVSFIVDLAKLVNVQNLTADGNGTYIQHCVPLEHCYVTAEDMVVSRTPLDEDALLARGIEDPIEYCMLTRQYAKLKSSPDFQRIIMKLSLPTVDGDDIHRYCNMVQYRFTGSRHELPHAAHGNAKKGKQPF